MVLSPPPTQNNSSHGYVLPPPPRLPLPKFESETCLIRLPFWDAWWEQFYSIWPKCSHRCVFLLGIWKRCRQTGWRQSTPLSTIRTRYGNSVSTPGATRTGKNKQNSLQKGSRYGISVSTPHRRYGHRLRTPFLRTPFPRLLFLKKSSMKAVQILGASLRWQN